MPEAVKAVDANQVVSGGPDSGTRTPHRQGSDEEREVRLVLDLIQQGKAYRSKFDEDWDTRRDFYEGKQWKTGSNANSKPVMNIIRQTIQAIIPLLTDQRPGFNPEPKDPTDYEFAKCVATLIETWWDNTAMDHTLIEAIFMSMLYDCGILKVTWDPDLEDGIGDVNVESIDPRDIYIPRGAQDFTKNCGWVIQMSKKTVGEVRRMFPKMADMIKADSAKDSMEKMSKSMELKFVSPTDQHSPKGMSVVGESADERNLCDIAECWIDDETLIEEEREVEGGNIEKIVKKKFPKGKLITILPNQNIRLQSVEAPYAHGKKPFVRIVDMILPGEFYGEGEAKSLMPTQKIINKTLAHIFDVMQLMANPVWIVEEDSGVAAETITNRISSVVTCAPGKSGSIIRDFPPALQTGMIDIYKTLIRMAEQESGVNEISQGRQPTGVTAASAIDTLKESSQTRIRMKERVLQPSLQQLAMQVVALMMQFYREPRVARITNTENVWPDYFEFFIEEQGDGQYLFNKKNYVFDPNTQRYTLELNHTTIGPTKGLMDIKIMSGTAMPWSKTVKTNIAFKLFEGGVIDDKNLLETLEWPDAEQIINRKRELAAAMPPPEGPGAPPPQPQG